MTVRPRDLLPAAYPLWCLLRGQPHEEDFRVLGQLGPTGGLFVDVGANAGQSAVSCRLCNRRLHILSFEPDPAALRPLRLVRAALSARHEIIPCGLGRTRGTLPFHQPMAGGHPLHGEGTFDRMVLETDRPTRQRLERLASGRPITIDTRHLPVRRLDEFHLSPHAIKIDTQGTELDVVEGATDTLARAHPVLMVENNPRSTDIEALLAAEGYRVFVRDPDANVLCTSAQPYAGLNAFYVASPWLERLRGTGALVE